MAGRSGGHWSLEGTLAALIVMTLCLRAVADVLPHLFVPVAVLGAVFVAVRLTVFHTRKW